MDALSINFADVTEVSFDPIPAGTYRMEITGVEERAVKNEGGKNPVGTPMLNWEFTVKDGEYDGRHVWMNTVLAGGGLGQLKSLIRATGRFTDDDLNGDLDIDPENDIVGAEVAVTVRIRKSSEYGDSNDVRSVKSLESADLGEAALLP